MVFFIELGNISLNELEEICISLGIANTVKEVKKILENVDINKNGQIEFNEFLSFFRKSLKNKNQA